MTEYALDGYPPCPNCGNETREAELGKEVNSLAPHGMLGSHDVTPTIVVGCPMCSETLAVYKTVDSFMVGEGAWPAFIVAGRSDE